MTADHHKLVIYRTVRNRDTHRCGDRYGTCHTWHNRHGNPSDSTRHNLLVPPREYKRIAPLEAHHKTSGPGPVDHDGVDGVLCHRPSVRDLGGVDHLNVRGQLGEEFRWRQPVGHDNVSL